MIGKIIPIQENAIFSAGITPEGFFNLTPEEQSALCAEYNIPRPDDSLDFYFTNASRPTFSLPNIKVRTKKKKFSIFKKR